MIRPLLFLLLLFPLTAQADLRTRVNVICVGAKCDAVEALGAQVVPALTSAHTSGVLLVEGEDPLARCLERLDRDKAPDVSSCVARKLGGIRQGAVLKESELDLYAVLVLQDYQTHVQGHATFLTPTGATFTTDVVLSPLAVHPDGTIDPISLKNPPAGAPVILTFHQLPERALLGGIAGMPQHRPLIRWSSPRGSGEHWGTAVVKR